MVDGPSHDLLARPGFASHENRAARAGHRLEQLKQGLHRPAATKNAVELIALLKLRSQVGILGGESRLFERPPEVVHQLVELERLGDEIGGAAFDGVHRVLDGPVARDHDGDDARIAPDRCFDNGRAVNPREA